MLIYTFLVFLASVLGISTELYRYPVISPAERKRPESHIWQQKSFELMGARISGIATSALADKDNEYCTICCSRRENLMPLSRGTRRTNHGKHCRESQNNAVLLDIVLVLIFGKDEDRGHDDPGDNSREEAGNNEVEFLLGVKIAREVRVLSLRGLHTSCEEELGNVSKEFAEGYDGSELSVHDLLTCWLW
jgi:hypothetical protein